RLPPRFRGLMSTGKTTRGRSCRWRYTSPVVGREKPSLRQEREGGEGPCPWGGSCRRCAVRAGAVPAVARPAGTGPSLPWRGGTRMGLPSGGQARWDGSVPALPGRYTTTLPMHGCTCHGSKCTKKRVKPRGRTQTRGVHRSLAAHRSGTAGSPGPTDADGTAIPLGDTVPSFAASNAGPNHGVSAERDLASRVETLLDVGPVDDVPEGLGVVGLDVLVLQVEGVLPHVQHEQWVRTEGNVALLVVELLDDQALTEHVPGEDGPAGTLDGGGRAVEVRAEGVEGAELVVDRGAQLALGLVATLGGEV